MRAWYQRIKLAVNAGLKVPSSWIQKAGKYAPGALKVVSAGVLLNEAAETAQAQGYGKAAENLIEEATVGLTQDDVNEFMRVNSERFSKWADKKSEGLYTRPGLGNLLDWDDN